MSEDQMRRLKAEARHRQVPIAANVREAVDRVVMDGRRLRHQRALEAAGRFRSGSGDLSARHDEIAGEGRW